MAFDAFLKIDGVPGESTDDKHKDWIEILSFSWGASQPASVASATGGRTAERVNIQDFSIVKVLDKSTPLLFQHVCNGKHIDKIELELNAAAGDKHKYMKYTLENVVISSLQNSGAGGSGDAKPTEAVSFNFGKVQLEYTPMDSKGKAGSPQRAGWDLEANKKL